MHLKSLLVVALAAIIISGAGLGSCHAVQEVTLEQILAEPEHYNGKNVILEGFYFSGFEVTVLAEGLEYSGLAEGHLVPTGRMIWIEGGIDKAVFDSLYQQSQMGPIETFGKIRIEGVFEYGEAYGHVGGYLYQITAVETAALPWSPDEIPPTN